MADPTKYTRQFDYSDNTLADMRSNLNPEFSTIVVSIDEIVEAIKDIRRSDGALQNEIVTEDSLHPDLVAMLVFEEDVWTADDFTQADVDNWNTAFGWGDHGAQGYVSYDGGLQVDSGGNARGADAIDLQAIRSGAAQVASGDHSAIVGGEDNTASGDHSVAMTYGAAASGQYAVSMGPLSEAAGVSSVAIGSAAVTVASAQYAIALGRSAAPNHSGSVVIADGATGTKTSSTTNQLSLYFANGARLNGNALLDASDLNANGGTIIESDDLGAAAASNDHTDLDNVGTNTHAQIDSHIEDAAKHREIDDDSGGNTVLWSAFRIRKETEASYGNWFLDSDIVMTSGNASALPFESGQETLAVNLSTTSDGIVPAEPEKPILLTGMVETDNMDASGVLRVYERDPGASDTEIFALPVPGTGRWSFSLVLAMADRDNAIRIVVGKTGGDGTIKANSHLSAARVSGVAPSS